MSLFKELKRRNVFRVGIAYSIASWLLLQLTEVLIDLLDIPDVVGRIVVLLLIVGFVPAVIFAWAFEMTPDGIKREKDVDRTESVTKQTGRKLDFTIIGVMAIALAYFIWESRFQMPDVSSQAEAPAIADSTGTAEDTPPPSEAVTTKDNSIAVLPFANRSDNTSDLYFTDGIHDDLLTQLAKISGLKVTSRTSVMEYRDTTMKIAEIAAELGVSTILEGGIQRAGDRIRINAQLIDVNTDEHLWAETFDREMTVENIFDIQSEITRHIVTAVRGELSAEESVVLDQIPTHSLTAYDAYLQAKNLIKSADSMSADYQEAESWVEKAIEYDPEFAQAWAMMVKMHGSAIWMGWDTSPERYQLIREALQKATLLGPFLPETLAARAEYMYRIENNFHEAEIANRAALKAKPGDTELYMQLGYTLRRTGKWEESVTTFQMAVDLDTDNSAARSEIVQTLGLMGEFERAESLNNRWAEKYPQKSFFKSAKLLQLLLIHGDVPAARNLYEQIEFSESLSRLWLGNLLSRYERNYQAVIDAWNSPLGQEQLKSLVRRNWKHLELGQMYWLKGDRQQAELHAQKLIDATNLNEFIDDNRKSLALSNLAEAYLIMGETEKALKSAEDARELMPESRDSLNGPGLSATHTRIMAIVGHRDEALEEIARLLNTPNGMTRWDLYLNPDWDFFRDDERFNTLARPLNLDEAP